MPTVRKRLGSRRAPPRIRFEGAEPPCGTEPLHGYYETGSEVHPEHIAVFSFCHRCGLARENYYRPGFFRRRGKLLRTVYDMQKRQSVEVPV